MVQVAEQGRRVGIWPVWHAVLGAFCSVLLVACATTSRYEAAPFGKFEGILLVMWVGETRGSSGDGRFVFVPDPAQPLTFTRNNPVWPGGVIRPGTMYTDGGSIPRIAQIFKGLSPWGYAPAYMIHDWMFAARHCIRDGQDSSIYDAVRKVEFHQSAAILVEAIRTLVEENKVKRDDVAVSLIGGAVESRQAQRYWDAFGACDPVSPTHLRAIAQVLSPASKRIFQQSNQLPSEASFAGAAAEILTRIEF